ncbi:hypothetical protein ACFO1B_03860 [Dactylosporangium siamense]|uniref:Uncharacterized protein n=1 Tax=Dactylosporangium siamense TaxID=685454 RepID=A0A919PGU2_9ACTN|nr:hypothetical protein [Dactylosporangium siamense]GIG42981.1 hypothetical protein Dsi01nite_010220 [Dactylosporangium siamense]
MSGYHQFHDDDYLNAADVNGYLMSQTVPRFASTGARDAQLTAPETGQLCWVAGVGIQQWDGSTWTVASLGGTQLIARRTLTSATTTVDFSGIPAFKNLRIIYSARGDAAANFVGVLMRVNGNSGGNYSFNIIQATGPFLNAAQGGASGGNSTSAEIGNMPGANVGGATYFGAGEITIPSWVLPAGRASLQFTGTSSTWWTSAAGGSNITLRGGLANIPGPYTSIQLFPTSGNWVAGSEFSLYGMA